MMDVKYGNALHKLHGEARGKSSHMKIKFLMEMAGPRLRIPGLKGKEPGSYWIFDF